MNFTYDNGLTYQKVAFDIYGKIRWFLSDSFLLPTEYKYGNRFIFARGATYFGDVLFIETNPLGKIYKILYAPYGVHHDIEEFNKNLLLTGSFGNTVEDFIYELDSNNGQIINTLDLKTVFQRTRQAGMVLVEDPDWFHNNTITWVEGQDRIIISSRNQSVVSKMSWPQGKIDWILAPHYGWLPMFDKYLLTSIGEPFDWQLNQHSPEILPDIDNNPNTIDILLFDNGNQRFSKNVVTKIGDTEDNQGYSRMVQFRINEKTMTVEQIWQFGKEYGKYFYTPRNGDADFLPNGNRLGDFNITELASENNKFNGTFFEVTEGAQIVWSAQIITQEAAGDQNEYRLERMDIYSPDANSLQIGSPIENLIPQEIFEKYGIK